MVDEFQLVRTDFKDTVITELELRSPKYLSWPLVYLLSDSKSKSAYIGETTDVQKRMRAHLKHSQKNKMETVHFITSDYFNKSATLDIESNLIRYIAADGQFKPINGNLGIANHQYYQQKDVYWNLFTGIWDSLRSMGIARHSLEYIDNSDLFKYSPYKSLSSGQIEGLKKILNCLLDDNAKVSLIEGGAGTGKSILAIFLFKLLKTDLSDFNYSDFEDSETELIELLEKVKARYSDLKMALVIPMSSFRKTISNVFKNIQGLNAKMVIGPTEMVKRHYDILIIDESHRLRRRVNLGAYFGKFDQHCLTLGLDKETSSELEWAQLQSDKLVLFYDEKQSIKPSDVLQEDFKILKQLPNTRYEKLLTQFRVKGGDEYVRFINDLFDNKLTTNQAYVSKEYEVFIYDSLSQMVSDIKHKETVYGLSRLVAGFAWEWKSKEDKSKYDIVVDEISLQWNSVAVDWVNSKNSINEVGCIHTIQGYDLNYIGVIIGPEIGYDPVRGEIIVKPELYKDKNGKQSIDDLNVLKNYIINIYKTILLRGIRGTYMYICDDDLRAHFEQFLPVREETQPTVSLKIYDYPISEQCIPYYNLEVAAGSFSELQQPDEVKYIELEAGIQVSGDYFACKVVGESMNKIIPNGSIALFKRALGGSRNGLICLVESVDIQDSDLGGHYTIKEYESKKTYQDELWQHSEIILKPLSDNPDYTPIYLRDEETTQLKVLGVFVRVIG